MSLPADKRIKKGWEFKQIFDDGVRISGNVCGAFYLAKSLPPSKFGVVITKKSGCSVARNRIRRLFKEALRLEDDHLEKAVDLVILPKIISSEKFSLAEIRRDLKYIFSQIR